MSYRVQPGDRSLPASQLNRAFAAADHVLRDAPRPPSLAGDRGADVVYARNNAGADQLRSAVLGISAALIAPADNLEEFKGRPAFVGVEPADPGHRGKFMVLLEPLKDGAIGRAVASGVVACQVDMQAEGDEYAEIKDGDTTQLVSGPAGSARILTVAAGTGTQWARVALGAAAVDGFWARLTAFDDPAWTWEQVTIAADGSVSAASPAVGGSAAYPVNPGDGIVGETVWMRIGGQDGLGAPYHVFYSTALPDGDDYIGVHTDAPGYRIEHKLIAEQPGQDTSYVILEWDGGSKTLTPYTVNVNTAGHVTGRSAGAPIDLSGLADGDELVAANLGAVPGYLIDVLAVPGLWLNTAVAGNVVNLTHADPQAQNHTIGVSGDDWLVPTNAVTASFDAKGHNRPAGNAAIAFTHADPQAQAQNFEFPDVTTRYQDGPTPKINIANATGNISVDAKGHVRAGASAIGSQLASLQLKSDDLSVAILGEITPEPGLRIDLSAAAQDPSTNVQSMGHNDEGPLAADTDTWTAGGANGLAEWRQTRTRYDHSASPPILYGYARLYTRDKYGRLYSAGGETRYVIDEPIEGVVAE